MPIGNIEVFTERMTRLRAAFAVKLHTRADEIAAIMVDPIPNSTALQAVLHKLIGTAGSYGFHDVANAARAISRRLSAGAQLPDVADAVARLCSQLRSTAAAPTRSAS